MAFTKKNDEAVSPVIGVILMVAITVILAAVIAAFVFGMAGNISKTKVVAITAQKTNSSTITVMNQGGQDVGSLTSGSVTTIPAATSVANTSSPTFAAGATGSLAPSVGSVVSMYSAGYTGKTEVTVIGTFTDGTKQVLLDTFV